MTKKSKASSPYQKYAKTAHRYSDLYQQWRRAVDAGNEHEANRLTAAHQARFLGVVIEEETV